MEVFLLISMAMALSSSSSFTETLPAPKEDSSLGSFRKSHALLSFFPILCKQSMSLNSRGECIKKRVTAKRRKENKPGANMHFLKHFLSQRRRKKPNISIKSASIQSDSNLTLLEELNVSINSKNNNSKVNAISTFFHESQSRVPQNNVTNAIDSNQSVLDNFKNSSNFSTESQVSTEEKFSGDIIVDLIKSTNLIANILQEEIKTDVDEDETTQPSPTVLGSVNETQLLEANTTTEETVISNQIDSVTKPISSLTDEKLDINKTQHIKDQLSPEIFTELLNHTQKNQILSKDEHTKNITLRIYNITQELMNESQNSSSLTDIHSLSNDETFPAENENRIFQDIPSLSFNFESSTTFPITSTTTTTTTTTSSNNYLQIIPLLLNEKLNYSHPNKESLATTNYDLKSKINSDKSKVNFLERKQLANQTKDDEQKGLNQQSDIHNYSYQIVKKNSTVHRLGRVKLGNKYPYFHHLFLLGPVENPAKNVPLTERLYT